MAGLVLGINAKEPDVLSTVSEIVRKAYEKANLYQEHFYVSGKTIMVGLIAGIQEKEPAIVGVVSSILANAYSALNSYQTNFFSVGVQIASEFVEGLGSKASDAYNAGANLVAGFAAGISESTYAASVAATAMANAAVKAAEKALDEHSPSKVMYRVGEYGGEGFVNAIVDKTKDAKVAGEELGESAVKGLSKAIKMIEVSADKDIEIQPVITPVVDLSNVKSAAKQIEPIVSKEQAVSISASRNKTRFAIAREVDSASTSSGGNSFNFTQNNYSPKALSRVEIYRQTKNQFARIERKVKA